MGIGEKPRNMQKPNRKNSLFGCPSIHPSMKWRPTVFRCLKTLKASRTYPRWERDPSLVGQKNTGLGVVWSVESRYDFYTLELSRSSTKVGWGEGRGTKIMRMGKILETNN